MSLEDFVIQQLKTRGIPLVTPSRYKKDVLSLVLYGYRRAGWSAAGALKFLNKHFPNRIPNAAVYTGMLRDTNKHWCSNCDKVLSYKHFSSNTSRINGLQSYCKQCMALKEAPFAAAKTAKYRAAKLQAIPKWANLKKIAQIYSTCPAGYHVDHIVPLQGVLVCGLHVEYNLQHLTAEANQKKSNSVADIV